MPTLSVKAHFDGKRIVLDEPFDLQPNSALLVTVLPAAGDSERDAWLAASAAGLAAAYGPNEPDYSEADIKE
jgi:hypothetical protein